MDPLLEAYERGWDLSKYIDKHIRICKDLVDKKLVPGRELGSGTYGSVSLLVQNDIPNSLSSLLLNIENDIVIKIATDPEDTMCGQSDKGYWCAESMVIEWIIGIYTSNEFVKGMTTRDLSTQRCINFVRMYDMSICSIDLLEKKKGKKKKGKKPISNRSFYITMDRIDSDLYNIVSCIEKEYIANILFQMVFAIAYYQEVLKMSHNDLSEKNIFISLVKQGTRYNDKNIIDTPLTIYSVDGQLYAMNTCPIICKVGDFGMSALWNKRPIFSRGVMTFGEKGNLPTKMLKQYDLIYCIDRLLALLVHKFPIVDGYIIQEMDILNNIIEWIHGDNNSSDTLYQDGDFIDRPIPSVIDSPVYSEKTAINLLRSGIFKDYLVTEDSEKVVEDGVIFGVL